MEVIKNTVLWVGVVSQSDAMWSGVDGGVLGRSLELKDIVLVI